MMAANGQNSETGKNTPTENKTNQNEKDKNNDNSNKDNCWKSLEVYNQHCGISGESH